MLRILVISLFVANLLLLGFQRENPAVEHETSVAPTAKAKPHIPTIHLYSEMVQDESLLTGNRQCFTLGPFHSIDDKNEVRLLLEEVSTRISERQTEALVEKGYWVFMPPYGSLLEANQALISLQALGLEDIGIIYDGEWKNAISLGYFMRQENAQRRKKSVEAKGYQPMIRVQRQGEPRYWLDYEQPPGFGLLALDMQNRPNDFMQRSVPCLVENTVEIEEADLLEPVEVMARLQLPAQDSEPESGSSEDSGAVTNTENPPQEETVSLPDQAVENEPDPDTGTGPGDPGETETEGALDIGQGDSIEAESNDPADTGRQGVNGPETENDIEAGQEEAIETESDGSVEAGRVDSIEPGPGSAVGTGPTDAIEFEPGSTDESGQEGADGSGPDDTIEDGTGEG